MSRETRHHTFTQRRVTAESSDSMGLNLGDLRRFLADAEAAGIGDDQAITVGGLSEYAVLIDVRWYWAKRIEVHAYDRPAAKVGEQ